MLPAQVNGYPALILQLNGETDAATAVRIDDGLITGLYAVSIPEKPSHMQRPDQRHLFGHPGGRCGPSPCGRTGLLVAVRYVLG